MSDTSETKKCPPTKKHCDIDCQLNQLIKSYGKLLKEMRIKRKSSQSDFDIPQRTIRRIEKGEVPMSSVIKYSYQLKPCIKEFIKCFKLFSSIVNAECSKCDVYCAMYGKSFESLMEEALRKSKD